MEKARGLHRCFHKHVAGGQVEFSFLDVAEPVISESQAASTKLFGLDNDAHCLLQ